MTGLHKRPHCCLVNVCWCTTTGGQVKENLVTMGIPALHCPRSEPTEPTCLLCKTGQQTRPRTGSALEPTVTMPSLSRSARRELPTSQCLHLHHHHPIPLMGWTWIPAGPRPSTGEGYKEPEPRRSQRITQGRPPQRYGKWGS